MFSLTSSRSLTRFVIVSFLFLLFLILDTERTARIGIVAQQTGDDDNNNNNVTETNNKGGAASEDGGGLSAGAYVGIAIGALIFILVISFICWRKIRRRNQVQTRLHFSDFVHFVNLQDKDQQNQAEKAIMMETKRNFHAHQQQQNQHQAAHHHHHQDEVEELFSSDLSRAMLVGSPQEGENGDYDEEERSSAMAMLVAGAMATPKSALAGKKHETTTASSTSKAAALHSSSPPPASVSGSSLSSRPHRKSVKIKLDDDEIVESDDVALKKKKMSEM